MNLFVKISGVILMATGFILAYKPDLLESVTPPADPYQMIEKRVKYGLGIGLGAFLIFHNQWESWGLSITALLAALTLGIIAARLLGFVMDGFFGKQLIWLLTELTVFGIFVFLYWRQLS